MNKLNTKPYLIFWLLIPVVVLIGFLGGTEQAVFNIHDTYYVYGKMILVYLISILFGIIRIGYWLMKISKRKLSKWLNFMHTLITIVGSFGILVIPSLISESFIESDYSSFDSIYYKELILIFGIFLIAIIQILFLINISIGIFKRD